ncbi:MAG TPA: SGNH/GDSL hydrolase family protein [Phenylobacterium sp.]
MKEIARLVTGGGACLLAVLAAAVFGAAPATGQTGPKGMVDDPCVGAPAMPASFVAYMRARYTPGATPVLPPAAELAAYRAAAAEAAKADWPNLCRYRADNRRLAAAPQAQRRIVFMGDSITEGWGLAQPAFFASGVVNRGISGQTTPQMLVRFEADVVALRPLAVHIMAGTNDIAGNTGPTSAEDVKNNIRAMTAIAKSHGIRVVLASIPPAAAFSWAPALKPGPQVQALNAWLKAFARQEGAIYVDYYAALATPDGALRPDLTFDGVHPNAEGYALIEPLARGVVARATAR